jgi:hypothetical protein
MISAFMFTASFGPPRPPQSYTSKGRTVRLSADSRRIGRTHAPGACDARDNLAPGGAAVADSNALDRVMDGASWNDFCDTLKAAGEVILADSSPDDPLDRAEGFRYLSAPDAHGARDLPRVRRSAGASAQPPGP